jgi:hypothetical protein
MKKLTKAQELKQREKELALIEKNAPLLFDIDNAILVGKENRRALNELVERNNQVVEEQRQKCLADHSILKAFLKEYSDLVSPITHNHEDKHIGDFGFYVGFGEDKVYFNYSYLRDWWRDADNLETIYGEDYPTYYPEMVEVYSDKIGETETFESLSKVFEDNDYVNLLERLVTKRIINLKDYTLVFEDNTEEVTRHYDKKEVEKAYLNQEVRTINGVKTCIKVIIK